MAASVSLTLSNFSITSNPVDGAYWDYMRLPYSASRDTTGMTAETSSLSATSAYDKKGTAINPTYPPKLTSSSASSSIIDTATSASAFGSVSLTMDQILKSTNQYAKVSGKYMMTNTYLISWSYFTGKGPMEFNISVNYSLKSDLGDNSLFAYSNAEIKLTSDINEKSDLVFDKYIQYFSNETPGIQEESGTISLSYISYPNPDDYYPLLDGRFYWFADASVLQVPEPQTYAMLLVELGLIGFSVWRPAKSSRVNA